MEEYKKLINRLKYYKNLMRMGELTTTQQKKYEEYNNRLEELRISIPVQYKKYNSYEEYYEVNKQRSKQRYYNNKSKKQIDDNK